MPENSSTFFVGPKPTWEAVGVSTTPMDSQTPFELSSFSGRQLSTARRIAATSGTEISFLISSMANVLEVPPAFVQSLSYASNEIALARKNLGILASSENRSGYRAQYRGAAHGEFDAKIVCIAGSGALLNCHVPGRFVMGLVIPGYEKLVQRIAPSHVPPYFAEAQFDFQNSSMLVTELRAPLWDKITSEEKQKFAAWPKVLLQALEHYLVESLKDHTRLYDIDEKGKRRHAAETIAASIFIPRNKQVSLLHPNGRFVTIHDDKTPRFAPEIQKVIEELGYTEPPPEALATGDKPSRLDPKAETLMWKRLPLPRRIKSGSPIEVPSGTQDGEDTIPSSIRRLPSARAQRWLSLHQAHFPFASAHLNRRGEILSAFPVVPERFRNPGSPLDKTRNAAVLTPYTPHSNHGIDYLTREMLRHHERLLQSGMVRAAIDRLPRYFIPVSAGPVGNARQNWAAEATAEKVQGEYLHLRDQNRHPSVRFQLPCDGSGIPEHVTVGFKGAGYLHTDGLPLRATRYLKVNELHSPMRLNPRLNNSVHKIWGGFGYNEAGIEFANLLGTSWLMHKVAPRLGGTVAEPIDFGGMDTLPVWDKGGTARWMGIGQHKELILGEKPWNKNFDFAVLRTVSRSDVRLSQAVNDVFFSKEAVKLDPEQRKAHIDQILTYIYAVHGHEYKVPMLPLPIVRGQIGAEAIAQYLQSASEIQSGTARSIFRTINARCFLTMSAIHAIGGHLGGIKLPGEQGLALRGGPLALRNVDCDGRLHDIDHFCYLPLAPEWRDGAKAAKSIPAAQALDVVTLQDTLYWTSLLLGQQAEPPHGRILTLHYGPKFSVQRFKSDSGMVIEQIAAIESALGKSDASEGEDPAAKKDKTKKVVPTDFPDRLLGDLAADYKTAKEKVLKVLGRNAPDFSVQANSEMDEIDDDPDEDEE